MVQSLTLILSTTAAAIPKTRIVIQGWIHVSTNITKGPRKEEKCHQKLIQFVNTQQVRMNERSDAALSHSGPKNSKKSREKTS